MARSWYLARGWLNGRLVSDQEFSAQNHSEAYQTARATVKRVHGPDACITNLRDLGVCQTCGGPAEGGSPCRTCRQRPSMGRLR